MAELIQQGGPTMLMILMLVLPTLVMVILHIVMARAWSAWISTGLIAVILAIGVYGTMSARSVTDRAVEAIREPSDREALRAEGYKESGRPLQLAAIVNGFFAVCVLIGEMRRKRS